ncbi:MAG: hypothetical protein RLZ55_1597 [Actinomycetota bacterium]|jgi:ribosomal-protein-alanine N-acetyltransferase
MSVADTTDSPRARVPRPRVAAMRWWHLPAVAELERQVFGPTAWTLEQFFGELAADRWLRVAVAAGRVVGYLDVAVAGHDSDLMTIAVAPTHRRSGLGGELLDLAVAAAAESGAHRMILEVRAENPAVGLYRSRGFERIDVRRDYYGPGADALVMRRRISDDDAVAHVR